MIRAVLQAESGGDPRARSSKGAMGLMQIMPETWADLRGRYALGSDPYDPRDSILAGAAYLRELLDRYGSPGFLAAYNAGPARYEDYLAGRPLPDETRAYLAALGPLVMGNDPTAGRAVSGIVAARSWTMAPLFAGHAERTVAASPLQPDRPSNGIAMATQVRDLTVLLPQSDGLFVRLGSPERRP
jgi:membrane-bound lytic murein transglycosylase B